MPSFNSTIYAPVDFLSETSPAQSLSKYADKQGVSAVLPSEPTALLFDVRTRYRRTYLTAFQSCEVGSQQTLPVFRLRTKFPVVYGHSNTVITLPTHGTFIFPSLRVFFIEILRFHNSSVSATIGIGQNVACSIPNLSRTR